MSDKIYSTIIVEDEEPALDYLKGLIEARPDLRITDMARDGKTALSLLEKTPCDILFLDIDLPIMTGIDLLMALAKRPYVIVTTGYNSFLESIKELGANEVLKKPFGAGRFNSAVDRAIETIGK